MYSIQILNESTLVKAEDLDAIVQALQIQVERDFAPVYGIHARLTATERDNGQWPIRIIDHDAAAPPGAVAWHTVDTFGRPYGIIPVDVVLRSGSELAPTIGHELLELLADPWCYCAVYGAWPAASRQPAWISYEICDPVEEDTYTIMIDGRVIAMTNFVTPAWFHANTPGPFDYMRRLHAPLTLTRGGYTQIWQGRGWTDIYGSHTHERRMKPSVHCRRHRRRRKHAATQGVEHVAS